MKRLTLAAVILAGVCATPAWPAAFNVGVETTDYMPVYRIENSNYTGFARELLDVFAAKYGHQFTYVPYPIARLFDEFAVQKTLDFKFPDNPLWQTTIKKNVSVTYSNGILSVEEGLLVLPANKGRPLASIS